jgi:hypothetical protein
MSFRDEFPDYERYEDGDYYYSKLPPGVGSSLKGLILRIANKNPHLLKDICHDIASRVPCEPTQNWGWDWLINDLDDLLDQLSRKKLHKIMDFMLDLVKNYGGSSVLEDLNDIFQEHDFGYRLRSNELGRYGQCYWELYEEPERAEEAITTTQKEVKDICTQSFEHLEQARDQLQKIDSPRAVKDALRDCLSAMEALINQLGGNSDIRTSTKALRADGRWGNDIIVKEGLSIWDRMHDLYPDIRHGHHSSSDVSREEALYWIERLMAFVSYISRRKKTIFGQ